MQAGLLGEPHHLTLLDGEMVVDEEIESGERKRRFLAYDLMALNGSHLKVGMEMQPVMGLPFKVCNARQVACNL